MRLPRRVPWESLSELEQVCSWIYTDENDLDAKQRAVNRVSFLGPSSRNLRLVPSCAVGSVEGGCPSSSCTRVYTCHTICYSARWNHGNILVLPVSTNELRLRSHSPCQWLSGPTTARRLCPVHSQHCTATRSSCVVRRAPPCCDARGSPDPGGTPGRGKTSERLSVLAFMGMGEA